MQQSGLCCTSPTLLSQHGQQAASPLSLSFPVKHSSDAEEDGKKELQASLDTLPCRLMTKLVNRLWGNGSLMQYLKTGVYTYKTPFGRVHYEDPDGKPGCDFFGINHYAR